MKKKYLYKYYRQIICHAKSRSNKRQDKCDDIFKSYCKETSKVKIKMTNWQTIFAKYI